DLAAKRPALGQALSVGLVLLTSGYALADPFFRPVPDVRIGSKDFMENRLLAEMMKLLIEHDHPGLKVQLSPNLGSNFAYQSLRPSPPRRRARPLPGVRGAPAPRHGRPGGAEDAPRPGDARALRGRGRPEADRGRCALTAPAEGPRRRDDADGPAGAGGARAGP